MTKEDRACVLNVDLFFYDKLNIDDQKSLLCYNLLQLAKAQKIKDPLNTVAISLELQAKNLWKCNLKGKKGYNWKKIETNTWVRK